MSMANNMMVDADKHLDPANPSPALCVLSFEPMCEWPIVYEVVSTWLSKLKKGRVKLHHSCELVNAADFGYKGSNGIRICLIISTFDNIIEVPRGKYEYSDPTTEHTDMDAVVILQRAIWDANVSPDNLAMRLVRVPRPSNCAKGRRQMEQAQRPEMGYEHDKGRRHQEDLPAHAWCPEMGYDQDNGYRHQEDLPAQSRRPETDDEYDRTYADGSAWCPEAAGGTCVVCTQPAELQCVCGTVYCSKSCQLVDWPTHAEEAHSPDISSSVGVTKDRAAAVFAASSTG